MDNTDFGGCFLAVLAIGLISFAVWCFGYSSGVRNTKFNSVSHKELVESGHGRLNIDSNKKVTFELLPMESK